MKVRYADTARAEANEILDTIALDNTTAAEAVSITIEATITRLRSFPFIGTQTDARGVHMIVARPYSYLIFYSVDGDELIILNIRHPRRRPLAPKS